MFLSNKLIPEKFLLPHSIVAKEGLSIFTFSNVLYFGVMVSTGFSSALQLWAPNFPASLFVLCQAGSIPSYFSFRCLLVSSDMELALLFLILQITYGWFLKTEAGKDLTFLCHVNTWIHSEDNFALILPGI